MAETLPDGPLVAFLGDDFTGASASMEVLAFAGLPTVLFLAPPSPARLAQFQTYRGIGIATTARARSPAWMAEQLPPALHLLASLGAPVLHYKVCSTFDSAPEIGSIGKAADLAIEALRPGWVPLLVADPGMGRYQCFGDLFAMAGDVGYRLDRHPTMSRHPSTPMGEADLARHLAQQTTRQIGLVDFVAAKQGRAEAQLDRALADGAEIISLDVLDHETLVEAGRLIWQRAGRPSFDPRAGRPSFGPRAGRPIFGPRAGRPIFGPRAGRPIFGIGSQGFEAALVAWWRASGLLPMQDGAERAGKVAHIAVVSGSVSPATAAQIAHAASQGFEPIRLETALAVDPKRWAQELARATAAALGALSRGRDPLVFTAAGPDDPAVAAFRTALQTAGVSAETANERLGTGLGQILRDVVGAAKLRRAVISGGDTSGRAAAMLGIDALTAIAKLAPGAPLCRSHATGGFDGLEITLKGGQVGRPDFFLSVKQGATE